MRHAIDQFRDGLVLHFAKRGEAILARFAANESSLQAGYSHLADFVGGSEAEIAGRLSLLKAELDEAKAYLSHLFTRHDELKRTFIRHNRRLIDAQEEQECLQSISRKTKKQLRKLLEPPKITTVQQEPIKRLEREEQSVPLELPENNDFLDRQIAKEQFRLSNLHRTQEAAQIEKQLPMHPLLTKLKAAFEHANVNKELTSLNIDKLSRSDMWRIHQQFVCNT